MTIDTGLVNEIRNYCIEHKKTVAVAESVTSGNIQAALSMALNASMFFQGGITAYNLGQKARFLDVDPIPAVQCNCVSEQVAAEMAKKVTTLFLADYGVAITGFASIVPEENINELYAFISVADEAGKVTTRKFDAADLGIRQVQLFYTNKALELLKDTLKKNVVQAAEPTAN